MAEILSSISRNFFLEVSSTNVSKGASRINKNNFYELYFQIGFLEAFLQEFFQGFFHKFYQVFLQTNL